MDLTEAFTVLIHLMLVLYVGYFHSGDKPMNPACNLEIIKTLEDYEYIQEGNIMIGGVITVNALVSRFRHTYSYDKFLLCLNRVFPDKASLVSAAFELASEIASKSPVAVQGTKVNLVFSCEHSVPESLDYMATWNRSMLQSLDLLKPAQPAMEKKTPKDVMFSQL